MPRSLPFFRIGVLHSLPQQRRPQGSSILMILTFPWTRIATDLRHAGIKPRGGILRVSMRRGLLRRRVAIECLNGGQPLNGLAFVLLKAVNQEAGFQARRVREQRRVPVREKIYDDSVRGANTNIAGVKVAVNRSDEDRRRHTTVKQPP